MQQKDFWVFLPIGMNFFFLCVAIISGTFGGFSHDAAGCALLAIFVSLIAGIGILGFVVHDIGSPKTLLAMTAQTLVLVLLYSVIYLYRLDISDRTYWDSLYFSALTWVGAGAPDITPHAEVRLVTATEAITGYVFLGLLVSVLSGVISRARSSQ